MNKVKAIFSIPDVLQKGKMVANPEAWKSGQITASVLAGLAASLVGLAKVFGYELPVNDEQLLAISTGILAAFGVFHPVATVASTDKIGINKD